MATAWLAAEGLLADPVFLAGAATAWILSFAWHEAGHAFVADWSGDPTPRAFGRVTLNPVPHVDLMNTILLPAVVLVLSNGRYVIGGAYTPIAPERFRHPTRDWILTTLAGPACNILLGFGFAGLLALMLAAGMAPDSSGTLVFAWASRINFFLAALNLLPIPPLDGSMAFQFLLPRGRRAAYRGLARFGFLILLLATFLFPAPFYWYFSAFVGPLLRAAGSLFGVTEALFGALGGM